MPTFDDGRIVTPAAVVIIVVFVVFAVCMLFTILCYIFFRIKDTKRNKQLSDDRIIEQFSIFVYRVHAQSAQTARAERRATARARGGT